jgi:hypothetical protein
MEQNNSKKVLSSVFLFVLLVVILFAGYFYYSYYKKYNSFVVVTPKNYPAGTKISIYKNVPPGFPTSLILENKPLKYSDMVVTSDNKKQMTVAYVSDTGLLQLAGMYSIFLAGTGWKIEDNKINKNNAIIKATLNQQNVLVTVSPVETAGTMVTFQYEQ